MGRGGPRPTRILFKKNRRFILGDLNNFVAVLIFDGSKPLQSAGCDFCHAYIWPLSESL